MCMRLLMALCCHHSQKLLRQPFTHLATCAAGAHHISPAAQPPSQQPATVGGTYNKLVTLVAPIIQRSLTCSNLQPPWPSELPDSQPPCSSQLPHLPPPLHLLHGKAAPPPPHNHAASPAARPCADAHRPTQLRACAVATPATHWQAPAAQSVGEGAALEFTGM